MSYPSRAKYVTQFKKGNGRARSRRCRARTACGVYRDCSASTSSYPLPEVSGSAFYVYALAYGVNNGILDRATYLPVIEKGWAGLVAHIYEDGRLGCIQPIGAAPGDYTATASYVFGTGAFMLAGSEVDRLAR